MLLFLNIRSLNEHYNDLVSLLAGIGCSFDVTGCNETWLTNTSYVDNLNLDGYKLNTIIRLGRLVGGVCPYVD